MINEHSYKSIGQLPYCCVPACITMIMDRRKIKHESQEKIGYSLGLIVPKEKKSLFRKVRTGKRPNAGYGTRIDIPKYSINHYLKKNKILLKEEYHTVDKTKSVESFIKNNLRENNDIMVCFNNKRLFGTGDYGHVCLITGAGNSTINVIDPSKNSPKTRKIKIYRLIDAIKHHGIKNRAGFWVITREQNS